METAHVTIENMACPECGRDHKRSKTGHCSNCYRKKYHKDPAKYEKHKKRVMKYQKAFPEKRAKIVYDYQTRKGQLVPAAIHALHFAIKRLERILGATAHGQAVYEPSKLRWNAATERENRFGSSSGLQQSGSHDGAGDRERATGGQDVEAGSKPEL